MIGEKQTVRTTLRIAGIVCLISLFLVSMVFISCKNDVSDEHTIPDGMGRLVIDLSSVSIGSRAAIPLSELETRFSVSDPIYDAYIYNGSGVTKASSAKGDDSIEAILLPGTYNLVVVVSAFMGNSSGGHWSRVGSGYVEEVVIVQDQVTDCTIELYPFDVSIDAPDEVECGSRYSVNAGFDSRNPHIYIEKLILNGVSSADAGDSVISTNSDKVSKFETSFSLLAGSQALSDKQVYLQESYVYMKLKDDAYSDVIFAYGSIGTPMLSGSVTYPIEDYIDFVLPPVKTALALSFHWNE